MKPLKVCLLIFTIATLIVLAACAQGASSNNMNCSEGGAVCIHTDLAQTFTANNPTVLAIKVTSAKDLSYLSVTLTVPGDITVDGPQNWENYLSSKLALPGQSYWTFSIKAGQTLVFNRVLHFPSTVGSFAIVATVSNQDNIIYAADEFTVFVNNNTGKVIRGGTPFPPYTPHVPLSVYGPGTPVPTLLLPSITPTPYFKTNPSSTPFSSLLETSYPPPSTPTPTPTSQSSPYP